MQPVEHPGGGEPAPVHHLGGQGRAAQLREMPRVAAPARATAGRRPLPGPPTASARPRPRPAGPRASAARPGNIPAADASATGEPLPAGPRPVRGSPVGLRQIRPCRISTAVSRCCARLRSASTAARTRTRSRTASSAYVGLRIAVRLPGPVQPAAAASPACRSDLVPRPPGDQRQGPPRRTPPPSRSAAGTGR